MRNVSPDFNRPFELSNRDESILKIFKLGMTWHSHCELLSCIAASIERVVKMGKGTRHEPSY